MLPEGWGYSTLGGCTKLLSGNTPSKQNQAYWSGDFPWVTVKDMKTPWLNKASLMLTELGKSEASVAPANSILVVTRGMALLKDLPISLAMRDVAFNQDIKAIVPGEGLDARFLSYQLQSRKHVVLGMVDTAGHGTGKLDTDLLKSVDLVLPPLMEQRRIANILATWDDAIASTKCLLANTEALRRQVVATLLDRHCADSERLAFADVFSVENHKTAQVPRENYQTHGALPVVDQGQSFIGGYADDEGASVVPPVVVFGDHTRAIKWVDFRFRPGADGTQILRPKEPFHPRFAFHVLSRVRLPNLGYSRHMSFLKEASFQVPRSIEQQAAIAGRIDVFTSACELLRQQIVNLGIQKAALMADLLTGKRRVYLPNAEATA